MNPAWDVGLLALSIWGLMGAIDDRSALWTVIAVGTVAMWLLYVAGDMGLIHGL